MLKRTEEYPETIGEIAPKHQASWFTSRKDMRSVRKLYSQINENEVYNYTFL